ncbi:hypothetical protein CYLTODRAFT_426384 [Cylindrobasidium torrendii FP15055 ss-10]|uniref:Uncharacterized protein n=1 Tax=Cylindrobasidium torrendii FP15055 ss-10 TaxID=1314674 RepID=A0A0D7AXJ7_9AGAR|nr:hypothetical protein CYLTODRAFT_426384 [Cylindrobasidium torrendii FP15055 ss-10]
MDNPDDNFTLVLTACGSWTIYTTVEVFRGLSLFHAAAAGSGLHREADAIMTGCGVLCGVCVGCVMYPWIMLCFLPTYHSRILAGCLGVLFLPVSLAAMITRAVIQMRFKDLILTVCLTPTPFHPDPTVQRFRYPLSASQSTLLALTPSSLSQSWCTKKWNTGRNLSIFFIVFACFTGVLITLMSLRFLANYGNLVDTKGRVCCGVVRPRRRTRRERPKGMGVWPPAYPEPQP